MPSSATRFAEKDTITEAACWQQRERRKIISNFSISERARSREVLDGQNDKLDQTARQEVNKLLAATKRWNYPVVISHVALFLVVIGILTIGYTPSNQQNPGAINSITNSTERIPTVDEVASVNVAAAVATTADYLVASNVTERADTVEVKTALAQSTDADYLSKPQFVDQGARPAVAKYKVQPGENAASVAAAFGLTPQTVKWANNLTSDALSPGQELLIPAVNGIVYTVKAGDTPDSLAAKYKSDRNSIVAFNDAELGGLQPGQLIVIPGGELPTNERPGAARPSSSGSSSGGQVSSGFAFGSGPIFGGNGYAYGYCTWHAANRRAAVGRPIPNNWGNATTWDEGARAMGLRVDHVPEVGAILQTDGGWGGYGHVAFVEQVNPDGSWVISEMNYVGWGRVSSRSFGAGEAGNYDFIH